MERSTCFVFLALAVSVVAPSAATAEDSVRASGASDSPLPLRRELDEKDKDGDGDIDRRTIKYFRGSQSLLMIAEVLAKDSETVDLRIQMVYHGGKLVFSETRGAIAPILATEPGAAVGVIVELSDKGQPGDVFLTNANRDLVAAFNREDDGRLSPRDDEFLRKANEHIGAFEQGVEKLIEEGLPGESRPPVEQE